MPIDGYQVEVNANMPIDYLDSLIHLYQPLIGVEAIHLYQLLLQEANMHKEIQLQAHHGLMNHLNSSLDQIYEARLKLEAIGLLQTFKKVLEDKTIYTYVLIPPFRPVAFFSDLMLSELLYRQIGKMKFASLQSHYTNPFVQDKGENITVRFNDVFSTFTPESSIKITPIREQTQTGIPIQSVDFSLLTKALSKSMIPVDKVLTDINKRIINQLSVMYDLEIYEMEKALIWALTDENELDIAQFKAACQDIFANKENVIPKNNQPSSESTKTMQKEPSKKGSKTEELIRHFEKISPKQLLEDMSQGGNASKKDLDIIADLSMKQGVPIPVLNVAIHYVMLQSNQQLSERYLETIVSNWSRLGYTTARQAVNHVQQMNKEKKRPKPTYGSKSKSKGEVIPDWFRARKEQSKAGTEQTKKRVEQSSFDEKERKELEALLKRHTSKNK